MGDHAEFTITGLTKRRATELEHTFGGEVKPQSDGTYIWRLADADVSAETVQAILDESLR